jgi:hypothetical protein
MLKLTPDTLPDNRKVFANQWKYTDANGKMIQLIALGAITGYI